MENGKESRSSFARYCDIALGSAENGHASGFCVVAEKHLNPWGSCHGGLAFTLMDTVAGAALLSLNLEKVYVTVSSSISYLRPIYPGRAECTAEVVKCGRKIAFVDAEIHDEAGKILSRASFEFCCTE